MQNKIQELVAAFIAIPDVEIQDSIVSFVKFQSKLGTPDFSLFAERVIHKIEGKNFIFRIEPIEIED